jgi:hypothetical protein
MAIALFSVAIAAASYLAFGAAEAGVALGVFAFAGLWLGKRAFSNS